MFGTVTPYAIIYWMRNVYWSVRAVSERAVRGRFGKSKKIVLISIKQVAEEGSHV